MAVWGRLQVDNAAESADMRNEVCMILSVGGQGAQRGDAAIAVALHPGPLAERYGWVQPALEVVG